MDREKMFALLPVISIFGYWLWACVISAFMTGDPRMLMISFVSAPLVIAMFLSARRVLRG